MDVNTTARPASTKEPFSTKTSKFESMTNTEHRVASKEQKLPSCSDALPTQKNASIKAAQSTIKDTRAKNAYKILK